MSRLAGVPVTTLRTWEQRYSAFAPAKTSGRHRLYRDADVIKARLLRQLAESGQGIGGIAHLPIQHLQQLLGTAQEPTAAALAPARRVAAVIVGAATAARFNAPGWRDHDLDGALHVRQVFVDLEEAAAGNDTARGGGEGETGILLVRLNTVHSRTYGQLMAAIERQRVQRVIVLYNYGPPALVEALRNAGLMVRREPVPDAELAELIRSVVLLDAAAAFPAAAGALIPRRRYSEASLAQVAASPSNVVCECPRHIAEIIGQLVSFEEYSEQCLNDTTEDARLHAYLRSVAGSARVLFEHALQRAARHGGIALAEDAAGP
ncbi:MerR family transcriptional regulator [Caenimonas sedimenti]|uniref:MerR family transcriptional regulator n=1 Tax=Caenimonas sedimenti TaxID=2596921 RepID=UPI001648E0FC|nr:MerR family transcriptional regulator [Caenimonas sedimenti]